MDYEAEYKRLEENEDSLGGDFWKPKPGQYRVKAMSELEDAPPYEEEGKEPQLRSMLHIEIEDKILTWNFPKGKTPASTYGQLVNFARTKGKLKEESFMIVVTGEGQNRRFTIVV